MFAAGNQYDYTLCINVAMFHKSYPNGFCYSLRIDNNDPNSLYLKCQFKLYSRLHVADNATCTVFIAF